MRNTILQLFLAIVSILNISCKKDCESEPIYNVNDSATVVFTVTSNQRYPLVFLTNDSGAFESINLNIDTDSTPITRSYKIGRGLYEGSAWLIRDSAHLYYNMIDSNAAWIKIEAVVDGVKVAEGIGDPIPGHPLQLVAHLFFNY
jgi:hypothetical protein